jgi:OTU domain-containing protein 6
MDDLLIKHRREQKDLQGKITQRKKNATKKTRKGVNDECEVLERNLKEKQQAEIYALEISSVENTVSELKLGDQDDVASLGESSNPQAKIVRFEEQPQADPGRESQQKLKKPNRQKARLARRAAEQEAQIAAAAEEAAALPDMRDQEMQRMNAEMEKRHLAETFVQPDGHCLYSACALGLDPNEVQKLGPHSPKYQNVRRAAADFISKHPDDFQAFLEEPLDSYVNKIRNTAEWGGQLELQAISRAFNTDINVLQADGRVEKIESGHNESGTRNAIWLAFYRHSFGLGEHYNFLSLATGD